MCVCACVSLSFSHLSVKVSIDHYLGPSSIHTNGLHYLLINTDGWRWAIWQLIIEAPRGWGGVAREVGYFEGAAPAQSDSVQNKKKVKFGWFLFHVLRPFSTATYLCVCVCTCVCVCVCEVVKISSESCQAKDRQKIKCIQFHYTEEDSLLGVSTLLLKLYWTAAPGEQKQAALWWSSWREFGWIRPALRRQWENVESRTRIFVNLGVIFKYLPIIAICMITCNWPLPCMQRCSLSKCPRNAQ